jgi:protein TonB
MRALRQLVGIVAAVVVVAGSPWTLGGTVAAEGVGQTTVQPATQGVPVARTLELAANALREGRAGEAESLLAQALATLRRERLALDRPTPEAQASVETMLGNAVRIGGDIPEPKKLRDVKPVYPEIALAARVSGIVVLETLVDADGHVANARILRSVALLDQAALDAVYQWKFTPTLQNGQATPVLMTVTVNFCGS